MKLKVVAVGKLRMAPMKALAQEYEERLRHYLKAEVVEVREARKVESHDTGPALAEEAENLWSAVTPNTLVVAMDERGEGLSSPELSAFIERHMTHGQGDLAFLIGGALGLHPSVRTKASKIVSLSKMTLPHELARVFLLEQLYRAMTIQRGEPYHK